VSFEETLRNIVREELEAAIRPAQFYFGGGPVADFESS
jgi:hypothetical protein